MKRLLMMALIAGAGLAAAPAFAQTGTTAPSLPWVRSADKQISVRTNPTQCVNNAGNEVACGERATETLVLASGNTASAGATVMGGSYAFNQICTGYGQVALRYRAADGTTMIPLVTRSAADNSGGAIVVLGGKQFVDVALTGTTGCAANLVRIP